MKSSKHHDVLGSEYLGVLCCYLREEGELTCLCLVSALVIQPVLLCSVLRRFVHATGGGKHIFVFIIIIKGSKSRGEIYTKHHSHSSPAGAESDSNPTAAAPSQTEITDVNRSDHSTTSKEMVAWRALVRIHLTRTQDPTLRYTMV